MQRRLLLRASAGIIAGAMLGFRERAASMKSEIVPARLTRAQKGKFLIPQGDFVTADWLDGRGARPDF